MSEESKKEPRPIMPTTLPKEEVRLTETEQKKLIKKLQRAIGTNDYFKTKGTLWLLLTYVVAHSPDNIEKWMSVRWLLAELAKFAQNDYGKKISGD